MTDDSPGSRSGRAPVSGSAATGDGRVVGVVAEGSGDDVGGSVVEDEAGIVVDEDGTVVAAVVGIVVVGADTAEGTVVGGGGGMAAPTMVRAPEAAPAPTEFTARTFTEYDVPGVRPLIVKADAVDAGDSATHTPPLS